MVVVVVGVVKASQVILTNSGYMGIVVGISSEVDESDCQPVIDSVTEIIKKASEILYQNTHKQVFFGDVKILIPKFWTNCNENAVGAESESYEESDIKIAKENVLYGDQPYTLQPGECGEPGLYIHLTPTYLTHPNIINLWGPPEKVLMAEWSKLRWGVFDEVGYPDDYLFPLEYTEDVETNTTNTEKLFLPTVCTSGVPQGNFINKRTGESCVDVIPRDHNCRFKMSKGQDLNASIFSSPKVDKDMIVGFCSDKSTGIFHNSEAPTKQNTFCHGNSTWSIILRHPDFLNFGDLKAQKEYAEPNVTLVQEADANFVLLLDYSESMITDGILPSNEVTRLSRMRRAVIYWLIHEVAEGSSVAIVSFSGTSKLVKNMTKIEGKSSREALVKALPLTARGITCIGCGLYEAIKVLQNLKNQVIILLSDGKESSIEELRINRTISRYKNKFEKTNIRLVSIAFGREADPRLEELAKLNGGCSFTVNDEDKGHMLGDALRGALVYQPPLNPSDMVIQITSKELKVSGSSDQEKITVGSTFTVDKGMGKNLVFRLDSFCENYITNDTQPQLIRPSNKVEENVTETFYPDTLMWHITVPKAEEGQWRWYIKLPPKKDCNVRYGVASQPHDLSTSSVTIKGWVNVGNVVDAAKDKKVIICAKVIQGIYPVLNASVSTLITHPDGIKKEELQLLDNGQAADRIAGDGIYCRYLLKYSENGRYSIKALASSSGDTYIIKPKQDKTKRRRKSADAMNYVPDYCCGSKIPVDLFKQETVKPFSRELPTGSLKVINFSNESKDATSPCRVTDLKVEFLYQDPDTDEFLLSLSWTAPGDDLDFGKVSSYALCMTDDRQYLKEYIFDKSERNIFLNVSDSLVTISAGEPVLTNITGVKKMKFYQYYYVALRSRDEEGNASPVSNIAKQRLQVFYMKSVPLIETNKDLIICGSIVAFIVLIIAAGTLVWCILKKIKEQENSLQSDIVSSVYSRSCKVELHT
ncbi:calcium-activated chloride channel regulator 1-like [Homarus americanus]|uniref:calcium-activated chloride channel regulator 1-like n=1 Tax=Homarus americanus TaxID=6706 RepID=UPI001C46FA8E|nr:calcium-activated chloride channel regulator 1-like [Homarus americanus]